MTEIINILFNPLPNAIMTLLTGLSLLYWLFTMLLGDGFDFGTDASIEFDGMALHELDADTDIDSEADTNTDHDSHTEPSFLTKAAEFINIGKAPLMVIVTLFKFIGWIITIISSILFKLTDYGWKSVIILVPVFILTYLLMHYVTIPIVKLYNNLGYTGEEPHDYLGRTAKMKSTIQGEKLGFAEVKINKDIIRLYVKSNDGSLIKYGEDIIIIGEDQDKKYFLAQKNINLNII